MRKSGIINDETLLAYKLHQLLLEIRKLILWFNSQLSNPTFSGFEQVVFEHIIARIWMILNYFEKNKIKLQIDNDSKEKISFIRNTAFHAYTGKDKFFDSIDTATGQFNVIGPNAAPVVLQDPNSLQTNLKLDNPTEDYAVYYGKKPTFWFKDVCETFQKLCDWHNGYVHQGMAIIFKVYKKTEETSGADQ